MQLIQFQTQNPPGYCALRCVVLTTSSLFGEACLLFSPENNVSLGGVFLCSHCSAYSALCIYVEMVVTKLLSECSYRAS